ncbi:MAG TPA: phosphoribosylpyrophosphate synthetase [Cyclobacteriaceae bacterium]|nr:phosphoribosylpyrophosphate synthetase [Cyclobacteriaceae bacterium]
MTKGYTTLSEALADMKQRGFKIDFNVELKGNWDPHNLVIVEVHRFEGETSSDDEAVVYGIETAKGNKGVLVNGYGISAEPIPDEFIRRIRIRR